MTITRRELWGTCGHCRWTWMIYGPLPAPVDIVCKTAKRAACPNCDARPGKVLIAQEADIVAAEARA